MISTHRIVCSAIIACALLVLVGCGPSEDPPQTRAAEVQLKQERQARMAAEVARKEAEKARIEAEKARQQAEAAASYWRTATWLAVVAAIGLLVVGTALGSSSQKDAKAAGSRDA